MSNAVQDVDEYYLPEYEPPPAPLPSNSGISYSEELITPEYAAWVLDNCNVNPRRLRKDKAAQYSADMAEDKWAPGLNVVGFDSEGNLVDGQHRFAACVMSGKPFRALVARGVSQAAVDNADRGFKRSVGDILKGKGEGSVTVLQAALNMCCRWDLAGPLSGLVPTWPQMEQYLADNPDIRDAVAEAGSCVKPPLLVRGSVAAPFIFRIRRIDVEVAEAFLRAFTTGVGLREDDPVLALRSVFLSRRRGPYAQPTREHDLAILIKAWNSYITGKPVKQIKWSRGGMRQETFPYLVGPDGTPWPFPDYLRDRARRQLTDTALEDYDEEETDD